MTVCDEFLVKLIDWKWRIWGEVGEEYEIPGINQFWVVYPFINKFQIENLCQGHNCHYTPPPNVVTPL